MSTKKTLVLSLLFTGMLTFLGGMSSPAQAGGRIGFGFRVGFPPPPPRHEIVVVRPGPHYVWVRGYWDWRPAYYDYVWVPGYWARPPRPHAVWVAPRYYDRPYYNRHHRRPHHDYHRGYWR
jgi:hypothetical protein